MAITIAITNQKGGVGKTTTCSAFCGGLTDCGHSVLAIDLDPQGNLSFSLGADAEDNYTMYDVFKGNCDIKEAIQCTPNCDVVAANILLSGCELELTGVGREYILREALSKVEDDYDYIIIDTPPALSILTINAYTAADQLIIPMIAEILSLQGIAQLKETIFAVKKYYNKNLEIKGILLNKYNPRLILTKEVEELATMIAQQLDTKILDAKISTSVVLAEAPAHGVTIIDYAPRSKACAEYRKLISEITGVTKKIPPRRPRRKK
ncbi:MAG: ParA family protein [Ruminococcaceae bacterium]|nr:ParA family protein [Oscillospiraceae bacterium]